MDMNETLVMAAYMLVPALFSLLGMAALGSPAIALLGETTAKAKKRVFYDKYGQQTGVMGIALIVLLLVVYALMLGVGFAKYPQLIKPLLSTTSPFFVPLVAFVVFAVFGLTHFTTWKKMRQAKAVHMAFGAISAIAAFACIATAIPAKLAFGFTDHQAAADIQALALPMAIMYALLIMAAAAALSAAYLVMRRNKDDFGRDYYNFSLPLACRWAALPMLGFLGCQGWLFAIMPESIKTLIMGTPLLYVWIGAAALGLICSLIWFIIAGNKSPLRLKGLAFLAVFLFWLMHVLNTTFFVNLMTMS